MTIQLTDTEAFEAFRPIRDELEARYVARVQSAFAKWSEENAGRGYRHYRYNDNSAEARAFRQCQRYVKSASGFGRYGDEVKISEDFLAKEAAQFAEDAVMGFVAKLVSKVGDIKMTNLRFQGNGRFQIDGFTNGHDVRVEQDVVYKVNKQYNLYCQWPARIYVDGKFTPAAKFDAAVAA